MQYIINQCESRLLNGLLCLLWFGLGWVVIYVTDGWVVGWWICGLFVLASWQPLRILWRPESRLLAIHNGRLIWRCTGRGRVLEEGSMPVDDIQKLIRRTTWSNVVDIQVQTRDGRRIDLPHTFHYLHLAVYEKPLIQALRKENPQLVVEDADAPPSVA